MITWGFVAKYSDVVTLDTDFSIVVAGNTLVMESMYILVTGSSGNIVWQNKLGVNCYLPNAQSGALYPIGAAQILTSGVVNGVSRTTSATGLVWLASPNAA